MVCILSIIERCVCFAAKALTFIMISEKMFQNVTIALIFAAILHLAQSSANSDSKYHQIRQNQLNRIRRSVDEYYDSLMPELYQPILKEHSFLRTAAKRAGKSLSHTL